jgi:hypothetical protein
VSWNRFAGRQLRENYGLGTSGAKSSAIMNFSNATTFLVVGITMNLLPRFAPALCPLNGMDGTSARELWLHLMGAIQCGIGGLGLFRHCAAAAVTVWQNRPRLTGSATIPSATARQTPAA